MPVKKLCTVLLLCFSVTACQSSNFLDQFEAGTPYQLSETEVSAVKAELLTLIMYPETAKFSTFQAAQTAHKITVCGFYQEKSFLRFYTPKKAFIGSFTKTDAAPTFKPLASETYDDNYRRVKFACNKASVDLPVTQQTWKTFIHGDPTRNL